MRVEALDTVPHEVIVEAAHDALAELGVIAVMHLDFHDHGRRHLGLARRVAVEDREHLIEGGNLLVGIQKTAFAQLGEGHLLDDAVAPAHTPNIGVVDHDELSVGGQVHVELHAEAELARAEKRRHRVLGDPLAVQAAVRVPVARDLAPLLVNHGVAMARRHESAGQARRRDRGPHGDRRAAQDIFCLHIQASMARRSALLASVKRM